MIIIFNDFSEIEKYAHAHNWLYDWMLVRDIYTTNNNTFSILTPFAYCYLEEAIRSTTSEYGRTLLNNDGTQKRKVGINLVNLAKEENKGNQSYCDLLTNIEKHFFKSSDYDSGDNRNSVMHGYIPPLYWSKDSFEELILLLL